MRVKMFAATVLVVFVAGALPVHAQNTEIFRIDKVCKEMPDREVLAQLASHLQISVDTLEKEKADHDLTYGQLYLAHALARRAGTDFKSIVSAYRGGKVWGEIAKERSVRIQDITKDERALESLLKKAAR